jgi:hypothetical protein
MSITSSPSGRSGGVQIPHGPGTRYRLSIEARPETPEGTFYYARGDLMKSLDRDHGPTRLQSKPGGVS